MTRYDFFVTKPITVDEWCCVFEVSLEELLSECSSEEVTVIRELNTSRKAMETEAITIIDSILINLDNIITAKKELETVNKFMELEPIYNEILGKTLTIKLYDLLDVSYNNLNKNDCAKIERTIRVLNVVKYYLSNDLCNTKDLIEEFKLKRRTIQEYLQSTIVNAIFKEEVLVRMNFKKVLSEIVGNRKGGYKTASIKTNRPRNNYGMYIKESD